MSDGQKGQVLTWLLSLQQTGVAGQLIAFVIDEPKSQRWIPKQQDRGENLHVTPRRMFGSRTTIPSKLKISPITALLWVPTDWQHCRLAGALHWPEGAVVDVAVAVDSVTDSAIDVVVDADMVSVVGTVVVVSSVDCAVDRVTAKVEDSDTVVVRSRSAVVSALVVKLLSTVDGRQGPAKAALKTTGNANAVNLILTDGVTSKGEWSWKRERRGSGNMFSAAE